MIEYKLLSKVLDDENFHELTKYNVTEADFTEAKEAFLFIKEYVGEHKSVPSPSAVTSEAEFDYIETSDKLSYLCTTVKNNTAKRRSFDLLQNQAGEKFGQMKGNDFVNWMTNELNAIKVLSDTHTGNGTNFATNGSERWEWYKEAEREGSSITIPTPYAGLTEAMSGGNDLGDYVLLMSFSNQGKSWIAGQFGLSAWCADFGVLHYSPEMTTRQTIQRLDTVQGHFSNTHLQTGELFDMVKNDYEEYLSVFNEERETPYIVKSMEDMQHGLSLDTIEADLMQNPNIKFVIIDGFNLMNHRGNNGTRNNMTETSRKLRQLFGKYKVTGLIVHQTTASSRRNVTEMDELMDGFVDAPALTDFSETIATIQDACTVLTYAYKDGKGTLAVRKARKPCVDFELHLHVNYNLGYITEIENSYSSQFGGEEDDI